MPFPDGKRKALTFSYDDGNEEDVRLIGLMNRYGLKGTFNLNSGLLSRAVSWYNPRQDREVYRLNAMSHSELYRGHEIAVHTLTHPHLETLDYETQYNEIALDKQFLSALAGYEAVGMATPYGRYNDDTFRAMRACGIRYCRVDVRQTMRFDLPADPLRLSATCFHLNSDLMKLGQEFLSARPQTDMLFYVWGHSYEIVTDEQWQYIEDFFRMMSGRDDIFYGTNRQVLL